MNRLLFLVLVLSFGAAITAGAMLGRHSTSVSSADVIARGEQSIRSLAAQIRPGTTFHTRLYDYNVADAVPGETREEWFVFDSTGQLSRTGLLLLDARGRVEQSAVHHTLPLSASPPPSVRYSENPPIPAVSVEQFVQGLTKDLRLPAPGWGVAEPHARRTTVRGSTAYAVTFRRSDGGADIVFFDARTYTMLREEFHAGGPDGPLRYRDEELALEVRPGDAIPAGLKNVTAGG